MQEKQTPNFDDENKDNINDPEKLTTNNNKIEYNDYNSEFNNNFNNEKTKILNTIKNLEDKFLLKYDKEFIQNKNFKLKEFIRDIQSKTIITEDDYKKLKIFALEDGGFINNENRQSLFKKILFHEFNNKKISILKLELEKKEFFKLHDIDLKNTSKSK